MFRLRSADSGSSTYNTNPFAVAVRASRGSSSRALRSPAQCRPHRRYTEDGPPNCGPRHAASEGSEPAADGAVIVRVRGAVCLRQQRLLVRDHHEVQVDGDDGRQEEPAMQTRDNARAR